MDAIRSLFIAPQFAWFLAVLPVIVLLYLLKLRRTEIVIPSTFLWLRSLHDLTANAPFQRLRSNLLLFLQLLVAALVVLALMRPFVRADALQGQSIALVIDSSASMQTREANGTRLELAKNAALQMVNDMSGNDRMMVISFGQGADVRSEFTDDRGRLRAAIESIEPLDTRSNIRDVLLIASSLAPDNPDVPAIVGDLEIVLFSDGNLSDLDAIGARAPDLTFVQIGESTDNAGIVDFSIRKAPESDAEQQTFVLVRNERESDLNTTLTLYFEDTAVVVEETNIPAKSEREVIFEHPEFGQGTLRVALDMEDAFPVDDEAWLLLQPPERVRTLIVGDSDSVSSYYIRRALALEPRVELSAVTPDQYVVSDDYDLIIFDGVAPSDVDGPVPLEALPRAAMVFLNTLPEVAGLESAGSISQPPVLATDRAHPVTRYLNPGNLAIARAQRLRLPEGARQLITTTGSALVADVSRGERQMLVVAFNISESNWPLRLSFPLFMQNVVSWTRRAGLTTDSSFQAGAAVPIRPMATDDAATAESVDVVSPDGERETIDLDPLRPAFFAATTDAGVYQVDGPGVPSAFAVNLLDRNESAITPAADIQFGRTTIVGQREMAEQTRELWRLFAVFALCVLLVEWWIYARRAWN